MTALLIGYILLSYVMMLTFGVIALHDRGIREDHLGTSIALILFAPFTFILFCIYGAIYTIKERKLRKKLHKLEERS